MTMAPEQSSELATVVEDSAWRLDRWEVESAPVNLVPQTEIRITFSGNQINGFGGCNSFGGSFEIDGERLSLGPFRATRRACLDPAAMSQETRFFEALQSVSKIGLEPSGDLVLSYESEQKEGKLYFVPQP